MDKMNVFIFVMLAEANKSKKVYKILTGSGVPDVDEALLTCEGKNFTCNLKKAFYIASAECKKNNLESFEVVITGKVAKFVVNKTEETKEESK